MITYCGVLDYTLTKMCMQSACIQLSIVYIIIVYLCTHTKVRYWPFCMYTTVCKLYAIICMHANVYELFTKSCCMHTNVRKLYTSMTMHALRKLHAYCTYFVASKLYVILFITNIILS